MSQDDPEMMLKASVAELRLLDHVTSNIIDASRGAVEYELAATAGESGGVWAAFGRLVILTTYTAIERLIVTFATERRVSDSALLSWFLDPIDEGPEESSRMPQLKNGIGGRRSGDSFGQVERRLLDSLESGGFKVNINLARRIVALKSLRNECAHVRQARADERRYRTAAGFSETILLLRKEDIILVLQTFGEIIDVFLRTWAPEYMLRAKHEQQRKTGGRIDLMSDLPIYLQTIIDRLERSRHVGRKA